ncbi:TrmH family RNA methyltransferase [Gimibacter soli]|uniref:RNA methyltransferase n=1 Tax=Gimibacter soli TaxID=3024400 RepID=A0AAE9XPG8_9PROT|nr:RNA methyltransferase [Gimibacter soli]WCL53827.1 RNA methyltransferase [Gimibacter soli]
MTRPPIPFPPALTSTQNARVKHAKELRLKKYRQRHGEFVVEGETFLRQGLKAGFTLKQAFVLDTAFDNRLMADLFEQAVLAPRNTVLTNSHVQAAVAGKDNPQPVIAIFAEPKPVLDDHPLETGQLWVALQEPRDPGNVGTVIRTADAVGADGVILLGPSADPWSSDCVRASAGSVFSLPVIGASLEDFNIWRAGGPESQCLGLALEGSEPYQKASYSAPLILMVGSEGSGLPDRYMEACDGLVRIPMPGMAESLNLAVSTAVVLYHAAGALGRLDSDGVKRSPLAFKNTK